MKESSRSSPLYRAIWRWHFLAGLFVLPFLILLALSGLMMLYVEPVDSWRLRDRTLVEVAGDPVSAAEQLRTVQAAYPMHQVETFRPSSAAHRASEFVVSPLQAHVAAGHASHGLLTVYVNPYTNTVTGDADPATSLYAWANRLHGTLLIGVVGDWLIEIAAGLALLLVLSGLYLWGPSATGSGAQPLVPPVSSGTTSRAALRSLHRSVGLWTAPVLLFFLVSGLSWTSVWGERLVQAWSAVPQEQYAGPLSSQTHSALDPQGLNTVPWALAQTPMPASSAAAEAHSPPDLDRVVAYAREMGFARFRVHVPQQSDAVWTIASTTLAKDVQNPFADRMVHLDRHSGAVLQELQFKDYTLMGKFMAAGVPLHQGDLTLLNLMLNTVFCLAVITLCGAAAMMAWRRRPAGSLTLPPPPLPQSLQVWMLVAGLVVALAALVPLSLIVVLIILLGELAVRVRYR